MSIYARKGDTMKKHFKLYKSIAIFALAAGVCLLITMSFESIAFSADPSSQGQSAIRRASTTPPPEVAATDKMQKEQEKISKSQARATKQQWEALIMKQDKGADRLKIAKGKTVPSQVRKSSASPPPHVVEHQKLDKQHQNIPKAQTRATRQQLEELIMRQAGGADNLKRAKGRIPPTSQIWQGLRTVIAWLNPFNVQTAYAQTLSRDYKPRRPATMLGNSPNYFDLYTTNPYGNVVIYGNGLSYYTPSISSTYLGPYATSLNVGGKINYNFITLTQYFPVNGWYIVNLNAYASAGSTVKLWHWGGASYVNLRTFTSSSSTTSNFPHLDYYTAGTHYFAWTAPAGTFYVYQVNVDSY